MSYFISIAIIFMAIFSLKYLTKVKFEILFPLVNLSIIFLMYCFGLFGQVFISAYIILAIVCGLFIFTLIKIVRSKDLGFVKDFFNPAVVMLLVFSVAQFVMLFAFKPNWWDELSHWGLVVKNMYYQKDFGGGINATTMFKGYPVGTSLYLYFFQIFGTKFCDGILFMALNLLNISLLMPVLSQIKESSKKIATALLLTLSMFVMYYLFLFTICNDMFLSLSFSYILIMYFCFKREGLKVEHYLSIFLATFVLCVAKSTGLALSGFAFLIIFVDIFIHNGFKNSFKSKKFYLFLCGVIIAILGAKLSWSVYLKHLNNPTAWQTSSLTLRNVWMYLINPSRYQLKVTGKYFLNLLIPFSAKGSRGTMRIPLSIYILAIIFMIKRIKSVAGEKECKGLLATIFTSCFLWIIALLVLYIFTFTEREALTLSSQLRYVNCLMIGFIVFLISYNISLLGVSEKFSLSTKMITASICAVAGVCVVICPIICQVTTSYYAEFTQFSGYISQLTSTDKVYIIDCDQGGDTKYAYIQNWKQEDNLIKIPHALGLRALTMRYIATPTDTSGFKVGGSPHIGDLWLNDMGLVETSQVILSNNYNYLYIHNIDERFVAEFGSSFDDIPTAKSLYKITWVNGNIRFERC